VADSPLNGCVGFMPQTKEPQTADVYSDLSDPFSIQPQPSMESVGVTRNTGSLCAKRSSLSTVSQSDKVQELQSGDF